jgi:phosphoglycolate phosphatase-like HAD superfamily hydrolase
LTVHLVWDWNGTLLDDLEIVVAATNACLAAVGGPVVTADEHRRDFRRPVVDFYSDVLGRRVDPVEFAALNRVFHDEYRRLLVHCALTADALPAIRAWPGSQSLLSMWFHADLVPEVTRRGLADLVSRVDGMRLDAGNDHKALHLAEHLAVLNVRGEECVLIGDSLDDAVAAASAGAHCVLYAGGHTDAERLAATGVPVATSLLEAVALAAQALGPTSAGTGSGAGTGSA